MEETEQVTNEPRKRNEELAGKYRERGFQQLSLTEYEAIKKSKNQKKRKLPAPVMFVLSTPFVVVFCFGLYFIPMILYQVATSKVSEKEKKQLESNQNLPSQQTKNGT